MGHSCLLCCLSIICAFFRSPYVPHFPQSIGATVWHGTCVRHRFPLRWRKRLQGSSHRIEPLNLANSTQFYLKTHSMMLKVLWKDCASTSLPRLAFSLKFKPRKTLTKKSSLSWKPVYGLRRTARMLPCLLSKEIEPAFDI